VPALHDAQLVVAREQGFASWPRFKAFIVESQLDFQGQVDAFINAAVSDGRRAQAMLEKNPKIAQAGFYVALVLGDAKQVARVVTENPSLVNAKSGPQKCEPLLYVCFSRYASGNSNRADDLTETARVLLGHGADPNAFFVPEDLPDNPLPCLYAASGLNNNPALTLALLEAGANPNDSESLYHSTEHRDLASMKVLLQHGTTPKGKNALKHMLDWEGMEGLRLLLDAGADPNEVNERGETALHWAVWRGRSTAAITALLDHGADIDRHRSDGRTAFAIAVISGQAEVAELLKARGADTSLSALDQFVATGGKAGGGIAAVVANGSERLLPDLTASHRTEAVRALLVAGIPLDARGEAGGTALHWACWKGYPDLVELLIAHGAPLGIEDTEFHAPPSGWLHHGTQNCGQHDGDFDYAQVARLLIAAGAPMSGCNAPTGNAKVDAVLREHKLIE
jgi:ankyrin repeat protein